MRMHVCACSMHVLSPTLVPLVLWTIVVNANDASFGHTLSWYESGAFFAAVALVGLVPWAVFVWA